MRPSYLLLALAASAYSADTPRVTIRVEGDTRIIEANGIANHATGKFPNRGNPNAISAQNYVFRMPAKPKAGTDFTTPQGSGMPTTWGVAVNGVPFDANTAEYWNNDRSSGWNLDLMAQQGKLGADESNAHVQPNGAYHYHATPTGLVDALGGDKGRVLLIGYAADGFPVYSANGHKDPKDANSPVVALKSGYHLKKGTRPNGPGGAYDGAYTADWEWSKEQGDLDQANGRFEVTKEYPQGTYAYHITTTFPYIPRIFRGTPDATFKKRPGDGARGPGRPGQGGQRQGQGQGRRERGPAMDGPPFDGPGGDLPPPR